MNNFVAVTTPGVAEIFLIAIALAVWTIVPILVVMWFVRKTLENRRENLRLRLEVGKLADELEQIRKQQRA